jgi:bifunctional aspartokinase / homoserine dehydrogenase 1
MRILKFGGSSVANPDRIKIVSGIIRKCASEYPDISVVVSAQSGVTDQLVKLCELIEVLSSEREVVILELEQRHLQAVKALLPVAQQPAAMAEIMTLCNELSDIVKGASLVGEVTPRTRDLILSFGERLSAYLVCQAIKPDIPDVLYTDTRHLIKTDATFGRARVNFEVSNELIKEYYAENKGLKIITGFIASSLQGQTTTLGRNGSDYTASIVGAAMEADAIEIWTDTDGVMTADPTYVKEAQSIGQLSYSEAMELSHFGAKVIFPASLHPAMAKQIPILVKNTFNPEHKGTLICNESSRDNGFIKGITSLGNICMITVEGSGMVGVAGVSARMFIALSHENISVILISQASSEHSICIALMQEDAEKACQVLRNTFSEELFTGLISSVNEESGLAIVAVVGENMRNMPGVAARVFGPLGRNGINVKAISQGSSELNISFVIHENDLKKALRILHQSLYSMEIRRLHLFVAGTGSVGSRLLEMIRNHDEYLVRQKIDLQLCGVINSRQMLIGENPIPLSNWKELIENDAEEANFRRFIERMIFQNIENSVFVDVTAADEPVDFYNKLLSGNIAIVAANKRANTQKMEQYCQLHDAAKKRNVSFHYETNVGAGLPVINVIRNIIAGGDKVLKIDAILSGTINWLLSEYNGSKPFSELVLIAKERGYTEPDPRDDLSGMDVARKCLILARECGLEMELDNIAVDTLMPAEAAQSEDLSSFFMLLKRDDPNFHTRYTLARDEGKKLRYVASIESGIAKVELLELDESHPFFALRGSENCIILTTKYYQQYPMVIKGPGAGVDVTAAGLLADIIRIAEGIRV